MKLLTLACKSNSFNVNEKDNGKNNTSSSAGAVKHDPDPTKSKLTDTPELAKPALATGSGGSYHQLEMQNPELPDKEMSAPFNKPSEKKRKRKLVNDSKSLKNELLTLIQSTSSLDTVADKIIDTILTYKRHRLIAREREIQNPETLSLSGAGSHQPAKGRGVKTTKARQPASLKGKRKEREKGRNRENKRREKKEKEKEEKEEKEKDKGYIGEKKRGKDKKRKEEGEEEEAEEEEEEEEERRRRWVEGRGQILNK